MMNTGIIKSFNRSKGYGFIRMDSSGREVFFHHSALGETDPAELRKGVKISFEVFDNQGRTAAKNLRLEPASVAPADAGSACHETACPTESSEPVTLAPDTMEPVTLQPASVEPVSLVSAGGTISAPEHQLVSVQNGFLRSVWRKMSFEKEGPAKRTPITRAALEATIADSVRRADPEFDTFAGVIIERVVPKSPKDANWAVKGVRYGRADRDRCTAAITTCVEERQREFEVSD